MVNIINIILVFMNIILNVFINIILVFMNIILNVFINIILVFMNIIPIFSENRQYGVHMCRLMKFVSGKIFHSVPYTASLLYEAGVYTARIHQAWKVRGGGRVA